MSISHQLEEATREAEYIVRWVTYVDHPEKRNETYPVRSKKDLKGTPIQAHTSSHSKKASALARAKELLDGGEDFGSEFTSKVEVFQKLANGKTRQIMKTVERERGDDGKIRTR